MGKIHELLAVENDTKDLFNKIIEETAKTFKDRRNHFIEVKKTYHANNEDDKDLPDGEFIPMVDTVVNKLSYAESYFIKLIDIILQKEISNQNAKTDIIIEKDNGEKITIVKDVPVIFLVQMESVLVRIRELYKSIPTLDPLKKWSKDDTQDNVWIANDIEKVRTKKIPEVIVKYDATDKHPAQTELVNIDQVVGKWTHSQKSGMISPSQKSALLGRIDRLLSGVKIARARANGLEAANNTIGKTFFNFINNLS